MFWSVLVMKMSKDGHIIVSRYLITEFKYQTNEKALPKQFEASKLQPSGNY